MTADFIGDPGRQNIDLGVKIEKKMQSAARSRRTCGASPEEAPRAFGSCAKRPQDPGSGLGRSPRNRRGEPAIPQKIGNGTNTSVHRPGDAAPKGFCFCRACFGSRAAYRLCFVVDHESFWQAV